jgi:hypothetical protein
MASLDTWSIGYSFLRGCKLSFSLTIAVFSLCNSSMLLDNEVGESGKKIFSSSAKSVASSTVSS